MPHEIPTAPGEAASAASRDRPRCYPPIGAHGVIGDLTTVALVTLDGCIDFCCLPRFDSPSVFAALLDQERGGCFAIAPVLGEPTHKQMYLPDTNVLLTRFLSPDGVAEISDFMPIHQVKRPSRIVRRVKAVRGEIRFRVRCAPRFDYARIGHTVHADDRAAVFTAADGSLALRLGSTVPLRVHDGDVTAEFTLAAGESAAFVLEQAVPGEAAIDAASDYVSTQFKETVNFWRRWIGRSTYQGRWRDMVHRSALVLKLLQSLEAGSIVAAPTFGLPEVIGGERNWDYRYTWIRDASFTLYALIRIGLTEETASFVRWIVDRCRDTPTPGELQTLYSLDGHKRLTEVQLHDLEGYRGSRPVRIGNAAYDQLQLDIYGELLDAIYLYDKYAEAVSYELWQCVSAMVEWVCGNWCRPDEGIWEVRNGRRHHLYSRVLCWVAIDRGLRLAEKRSLPAPIARWRAARDAIYRDVFDNFWSPQIEAFVGTLGSTDMDAACLIMPLVRFIAPTDPRWISTLRALNRRLVDDSLVYRYEVEGPSTDGLCGVEGTFSICSFWYVECLSRAGDVQQARYLLEKLFGYANHVGLYAEEIGPSGELLGNFPQAFTHLGLISAAFDVNRRLERAGWSA